MTEAIQLALQAAPVLCSWDLLDQSTILASLELSACQILVLADDAGNKGLYIKDDILSQVVMIPADILALLR